MSQKADTILQKTRQMLSWCYLVHGRVYVVINLTVTAGDCWHIRTMSDLNKQKVNI